MYRGYPVGYLLFWEAGEAGARKIGSDDKQLAPTRVIVDGQQRLTSLYAVIKGIALVRENYATEKIEIAFNPLEDRFEVPDAAIRRNKAFIPSISAIWDPETNPIQFAGAPAARTAVASKCRSSWLSPCRERKVRESCESALRNAVSGSCQARASTTVHPRSRNAGTTKAFNSELLPDPESPVRYRGITRTDRSIQPKNFSCARSPRSNFVRSSALFK